MPSKTYWLIISLSVILVIFRIGLRYIEKTRPTVYKKKDFILTEAERVFFTALREVIADWYDIFPQVSLLEVLALPSGLSRREYYSTFNRIQAKHIDFLLCEKDSTKPVLAIELDDSSHFRADRIAKERS